MKSEQEMVLGLARGDVPGGLEWRGVRATDLGPYLAAVAQKAIFRPREEAEHDPTWKQVIPYTVLRDGERLFLMRRSRAGADARLHDRYSIGVGGHVNPEDGGVLGGLRREWTEEIEADFSPEFEFLGLLNDDSDAVGAVHLGLVFVAAAEGRSVGVRETHKLSGEFATRDEISAVAHSLETWSALLFDHLNEGYGGGVG